MILIPPVAGSLTLTADIQIGSIGSGQVVTAIANPSANIPTPVLHIKGQSGSITLTTLTLTSLAALSTAWTHGGVIESGSGFYRLDFSVSAFIGTLRISGVNTSSGYEIFHAGYQMADSASNYLGANAITLQDKTGISLAANQHVLTDNLSSGGFIQGTLTLNGTTLQLNGSPFTVLDTAGITTLLTRLSATRAGYLDNCSNSDVLTGSRLATSAYTAPTTPPTAAQNADAVQGRTLNMGTDSSTMSTSILAAALAGSNQSATTKSIITDPTAGNNALLTAINAIIPGTIGGTRAYWLTVNDSASNAIQSAHIRLADSISGISQVLATDANGRITTVLNDVTMHYWGNKDGFAPISGNFTCSSLATASTLTMTAVVVTAPTSSSYGTVACMTLDQAGNAEPLSWVKWIIQDPSHPMVVWSGSSQSDTSAVWQLPVTVGHTILLTVGSGTTLRSFSYGPVTTGTQWIT